MNPNPTLNEISKHYENLTKVEGWSRQLLAALRAGDSREVNRCQQKLHWLHEAIDSTQRRLDK